MEHIVIIGNGISGVTLARHIRKNSDKRITIISEESEFFFSRTALMYVYMGHMKFEHTQPYENSFWTENQIELIKGTVTQIDFDQKQINLNNGNSLKYTTLILAKEFEEICLLGTVVHCFDEVYLFFCAYATLL